MDTVSMPGHGHQGSRDESWNANCVVAHAGRPEPAGTLALAPCHPMQHSMVARSCGTDCADIARGRCLLARSHTPGANTTRYEPICRKSLGWVSRQTMMSVHISAQIPVAEITSIGIRKLNLDPNLIWPCFCVFLRLINNMMIALRYTILL